MASDLIDSSREVRQEHQSSIVSNMGKEQMEIRVIEKVRKCSLSPSTRRSDDKAPSLRLFTLSTRHWVAFFAPPHPGISHAPLPPVLHSSSLSLPSSSPQGGASGGLADRQTTQLRPQGPLEKRGQWSCVIRLGARRVPALTPPRKLTPPL